VKHLFRSAHAVLRLCALSVLILGIALWQGKLSQFLGLHLALGLLFVSSVWVVAIVATTARVSTRRALLLLVLGIAIILLGLGQVRVLLGPLHWLVRTGHLLMGLVAIVQSEVLAKALRAHYATVVASNRDSTIATHSAETNGVPS
jgi:hypothetical protein